MSNKEMLQSYNTRLSTNNISLSDILDKINNLPTKDETDSGSQDIETNIFITDSEPDTKEGIWLKTTDITYDKILIENNPKTEPYSTVLELGDWVSLATIPMAHKNAAAAAIGTDIYLFGSNGSNTYYKYNTLSAEYTNMGTMPFTGHYRHPVVIDTNVYIFGGATGTASNTYYIYDSVENTFTEKNSSIYFSGSTTAIGTDIYLFGGNTNTTQAFKFNTLTEEITTLSAVPYSHWSTDCAAVGTDIYLFGGETSKRTVYKYNTLTDSYTVLTSTPYDAWREGVIAYDKYIFLLGGSGDQNATYVYDTENDTYTTGPDIPFNFFNGGYTLIDNTIYLFGGEASTTSAASLTVNGIPGNGYENKLIILSQEEPLNKTELFNPSNTDGQYKTFFNNAWYYNPETGLSTDIEIYYGDGTTWRLISDHNVDIESVPTPDGRIYFNIDDFIQIGSTFSIDDNVMNCVNREGQFNGVYLRNVEDGIYYMTLTTTKKSTSSNGFWYVYKYDSSYFYVVNFAEKKFYKLGESGSISEITTHGSFTSTIDYEKVLKIEIQGNTQYLYTDNILVGTITDSNTIGAACGSQSFDGTNFSMFSNLYKENPIKLQDKTIEITENGTAIVFADEGYDGLSSVEITTNVLIDNDRCIEDCSELFNVTSDASHSLITRLLPYCKPTNAYKMFYQNTNVTGAFDVTNLDVSQCTTCESMFENMTNVTSFDVSNFNTSACTNMQSMFIYFGSTNTEANKLDLTSFDTTNVTNMSYMFWGGKYISELDLSSFDFTNVTTTTAMFYNCGTSLSSPTVVYVKDETAQTWILNLSAPASRPSTWSTDNVIIKET